MIPQHLPVATLEEEEPEPELDDTDSDRDSEDELEKLGSMLPEPLLLLLLDELEQQLHLFPFFAFLQAIVNHPPNHVWGMGFQD